MEKYDSQDVCVLLRKGTLDEVREQLRDLEDGKLLVLADKPNAIAIADSDGEEFRYDKIFGIIGESFYGKGADPADEEGQFYPIVNINEATIVVLGPVEDADAVEAALTVIAAADEDQQPALVAKVLELLNEKGKQEVVKIAEDGGDLLEAAQIVEKAFRAAEPVETEEQVRYALGQVNEASSEEESDVIADIVERLTNNGKGVVEGIAGNDGDDLQEAANSVLEAANAG